MKLFQNSSKLILATLSSAFLAACGGGQSTSAQPQIGAADSPTLLSGVSTFTPVISTGSTAVAPALPASLQPSPVIVPATDVITDVTLASTQAAGASQTNVPVTFGQVFAPGDLLSSKSLVGRLPDGTALPLQVDVKATHPDGSIRHVIVSAVLPTMAPGESRTIGLARTAPPAAVAPAPPAAMLAAGFTSSVNLTIDGQVYTASADNLLKGNYTSWLAGATANEWIVSAPLKNASGVAHPHLSARFAVRWFGAAKKARVDVTLENDWAYEAAPQNFTYDAQILVGGKTAYSKTALTHFHHARWRKMFWWGETPQVHILHNAKYLINSRAVPNYDQSVKIAEAAQAGFARSLSGPLTEPMSTGTMFAYMPTTGGRADLGLLPSWSAAYLLSMDKRAKDVMLLNADLAGSYSSHYRDKLTDRPVTLADYPYMTILGRATDTLNPMTKKYESFPDCASAPACATPNYHDSAHQPNVAYLPYLVTGDYYYLEELQFWTMWNSFESNPGYRENIKGLLNPGQIRGQAWSLRTLAEAAYITPDGDRFKSQFVGMLNYNLDWYNAQYSNNPSANKLGVLDMGIGYNNGLALAPWQDDFFTSAVGHTLELGFKNAAPLLDYKIQFPIMRMTGSGACWIDAAIYNLNVRDTVTGSLYTTIEQAYRASHAADFNALACNSPQMATALGLLVGEMTGGSSSTLGYPSNMQPALAYSADRGASSGVKAWQVFNSRSVKPNYSSEPQFAIVPR